MRPVFWLHTVESEIHFCMMRFPSPITSDGMRYDRKYKVFLLWKLSLCFSLLQAPQTQDAATFWKDPDNVLDLLANGLEQNSSLQSLDLTYSHLNDDDLRLLLSCLPRCPNLADIDVSSFETFLSNYKFTRNDSAHLLSVVERFSNQ